MREDVEVDKF